MAHQQTPPSQMMADEGWGQATTLGTHQSRNRLMADYGPEDTAVGYQSARTMLPRVPLQGSSASQPLHGRHDNYESRNTRVRESSRGNSTHLRRRPSGPIKRRVTRACDPCHRLRTRCDGKRPCSHCQGECGRRSLYSSLTNHDQKSALNAMMNVSGRREERLLRKTRRSSRLPLMASPEPFLRVTNPSRLYLELQRQWIRCCQDRYLRGQVYMRASPF